MSTTSKQHALAYRGPNQFPPGSPSLSPAQLLERACASFDHGFRILTEAANGLLFAATRIGEDSIRAKRQEIRLRTRQAPSSHIQLSYQPTLASTAIAHQPIPKPKLDRKKKSQTRLTVSPHFAQPASAKVSKKRTAPKTSPYFSEPFSHEPTPLGLKFVLQPSTFGLIQERICGDLYALVVQAILWNKTKGKAARPVLWDLLCRYPTPHALADACKSEVEEAIRTLGLQRTRAQRLVDMATTWVASPPCPERRYGRRNYPRPGSNRNVKQYELLGLDDVREGWEIGHLPGVGEYALDSFRIFGRDRLRSLHHYADVEPEWKRLVPKDKELGPYVRWKWAKEGWDYDVETGIRTKSRSQTDSNNRIGID